jgi:dTDP-glucose pyrophosphorylase
MKKYCIYPNNTLLECLRVIDASAAGVALAVDSDFRLIGTVSDGDIRRALLKGYLLESPVLPFINQNCFCVLPTIGRAEVLDIMQARKFEQVPVVDEGKRVVGLHLLHDLLGRVKRPNWAVIMAGGTGTRLRPLTENIPKPMLKVAGRPMLERIILHLISFGITNIYISVNYLSHIITDYFEDGKRFGCSIKYLREDQPLGTGGALSLLPQTPTMPLLVLNGDLVVQFDVGAMLECHTSKGYIATIAVHDYVHTIPYGVVETNSCDTVSEITEKPVVSWRVNAGVYVIEPHLIEEIPVDTCFTMPALIELCLKKKKTIGIFYIGEEWVDVGRPEDLMRACGKANSPDL